MNFLTNALPPAAVGKPDRAAPNEWVILAARRDRDIVEVVQQRTRANGLVGCHVIWAADGPIRIYAGIEDMWDDLFGAQVAQEGVMPGELLTIREAAKRLRVPEVNLWHLIQAKKVPSIQIKAGQWRVSAAVVSALSGDLPDKPRTEPLPSAQGNKLAEKAAVDSKRKSKTTAGKKLRRTVSEISDELLTIEDAAKRLRLRPVDIRRLLRQHKLPAVKIDSYEWRVPAIALLDYIGGVGGNDEAQRRINSAVAWAREKLTSRRSGLSDRIARPKLTPCTPKSRHGHKSAMGRKRGL